MIRNAVTCALVLASCGAAHADDKNMIGQSTHLLRNEAGRGTNSPRPYLDSGALTLVEYDLTGADFVDTEGDPNNIVYIDWLPPNAHVVAIGWETCQVAYSPSWLSEMVVKFSDSAQSDAAYLTPGFGDTSSGTSTYSSGGLVDLVGVGADFVVGADGILRFELFETFDDFPDAADGEFCPIGAAGATQTIITVGYLSDSACECYWDNGDIDPEKDDGQRSLINGWVWPDDPRGHEESRAADDFVLAKGSVYRIDSIGGYVITNQDFDGMPDVPKAILELYRDCDGCPEDEPIGTWELTDSQYIRPSKIDGFYLAYYEFDIGDCWLEGNSTYWVSIIGVEGYFDPEVATFFAATGEPIRSAVSKARDTIDDTPLGDKWTSTASINLACKELAFTVCATPCIIVCDSGDFDYDGVPSVVDTTLPSSRGADNFVLEPCHDYEICFAQGYVATNCDPENGYIELYANACNTDDDEGPLGDGPVGDPLYSAGVSKVIDTGETVTIDNKVLRIYCLQFHDLEWFVMGNANYWVSIVNRGTGSFNERGYFAFNKDCRRDCLIKFSQARFRSPGAGYNDWVPVESVSAMGPRDLAFLIAADPTDGQTAPLTGCWVDVDGNGVVNGIDLGLFIHAYAGGCDD